MKLLIGMMLTIGYNRIILAQLEKFFAKGKKKIRKKKKTHPS